MSADILNFRGPNPLLGLLGKRIVKIERGMIDLTPPHQERVAEVYSITTDTGETLTLVLDGGDGSFCTELVPGDATQDGIVVGSYTGTFVEPLAPIQ